MPLMKLPLAAGLASFALGGGAQAQDLVAAAPSRHVRFDGIRVRYKVLGQAGPALVLVHGWTCHLGFWRGQAPLAESVRLVLVDLPGHGDSDKPERAYTMELFARAVEAVMRDAGIERAVLGGHSMGTPVVWQLWRLFPSKARGLIAVDGSFRSFVSGQAERERWAARYRGPDYEKVMAGVIDGMAGTAMPAAMRAEIRAEMLKTPQHVAASASYEMNDPAVFASEPRISIPVLAVYAEAPHWGREYRKSIEAFIPTLDFRTLAGVGHFLMMEKPAELNALVLEFLRRQGWLAS